MNIPKKRVRALPLALRVAWATAIVERVLRLYSDYFVSKYQLKKPVDHAWHFAVQGKSNEKDRRALVESIGERVEEADLEGYGFQVMAMGVELIEEIDYDRGDNAVAAVEDAAWAFSVHQLHQQGLSDGDPRVPLKYAESLGDPVYKAAIEALEIAEQWNGKPVERGMFNDVRLDVAFERLPKGKLKKSTGPHLGPPKHETAQ
jgi:hypothetical protein